MSQNITDEDTYQQCHRQDAGANHLFRIPFLDGDNGNKIAETIHNPEERERKHFHNEGTKNGNQWHDSAKAGESFCQKTKRESHDSNQFLIYIEME